MIALFSRILKLSGSYKGHIQGAFLCAFLESILSKMPVFLTFIVLTGFSQNTLTGTDCLYAGFGLAGIVIAQAGVHYLSDRLQSAAGFMMFAHKRIELGRHLGKLPMGYFTSGNVGKISSVLSTDMVFIEEAVMSTLANMLGYVLSAAVLLVFMFSLNWLLGLVAAIVTLAASLAAKRMNHHVSLQGARERQEQSEHLTDAVLSFAEGISVIKSYHLLGEKSGELTDNFKRSKDASTLFERRMTPWTSGLNVIYGIGAAAILALSVFLEQRGGLSLPYLLGVILFVFDLFSPLKALYGEASRLTVMNAALDRIDGVFDEAQLPDDGTMHFAEYGGNQPAVRFDHVTFAYQEEEILHDITFDMERNTMTALVGPSGGGKSTVANLLARLWDVKSGKITVNGTDIRSVPLAGLMEQISMVFQRVYLFQDTIYNNISMGKPEADEAEVYEAARKARCYDFIMALPEGFQTVVGEGGASLSGGEKQRISIARCILKDAPIVILDEATASVDADNESYIQEAISQLVKGKTLLVIAHRLNTIQSAHKILVISNGRIVQSGSHHELVSQKGIYQEFVNIRKRASGWNMG